MKSFEQIAKELSEKKMYVFHKDIEEITNVSGDLAQSPKTAGPGTFKTVSGPDGPTLQRKKRKELELYKGKKFTVSKEQFEKFKSAGRKIRGNKWRSYVDENSEIGKDIKRYSLRNPSRPVVIENGETGETMFLRRRWNDNRLRHNTKKRMENKQPKARKSLDWNWN